MLFQKQYSFGCVSLCFALLQPFILRGIGECGIKTFFVVNSEMNPRMSVCSPKSDVLKVCLYWKVSLKPLLIVPVQAYLQFSYSPPCNYLCKALKTLY